MQTALECESEERSNMDQMDPRLLHSRERYFLNADTSALLLGSEETARSKRIRAEHKGKERS